MARSVRTRTADPHTARGLDRLVNFSDATVAIAITLLVLPLVDLAGELNDVGFWQLVLGHLGTFIAFLVSFVVIARLWIGHHRLFESVADYSRALLWENFLWLAGIVFLPFATNAVSVLPTGDGASYGVYVGTMALVTVAMILMESELRRHPALVREDARGSVALAGSLALLILLVVAGALVVLFPLVGMFWLLVLFLSRPVEVLLVRISPRLGAAAGGGRRG